MTENSDIVNLLAVWARQDPDPVDVFEGTLAAALGYFKATYRSQRDLAPDTGAVNLKR